MASIRTRPATKEYCEGWERTFGNKSERAKSERRARRAEVKMLRKLNDAAKDALRRYAPRR